MTEILLKNIRKQDPTLTKETKGKNKIKEAKSKITIKDGKTG